MRLWRGADLSPWTPDVSRALRHGIRFALVKLTEGTGYVSPVAGAQIAELRRRGVYCGVYHYLQTGASGQDQWRHCRAELERLPRPDDLVVALDYEQAGTTDAQARAWLASARADGYRPGLYASLATHASKRLGQAWTWVAAWQRDPPPGDWVIWQFAAGVGGDPDWDVLRADDLAAWWADHAGRGRVRVRVLRRTGGPLLVGPYWTPALALRAALRVSLRHPRLVTGWRIETIPVRP